ncbi:MAG: hypothetical protein AABY16_00405 [Nanoarchaeota archaeon]
MVELNNYAQQLGLNVTGFATDKIDVDINSSELLAGVWQSLPPEILQKFSLMLDIGKWVLIAVLAYFIIKIIFQLMKITDSANIAAIAVNTKNINAKIDALMHKKEKKDRE